MGTGEENARRLRARELAAQAASDPAPERDPAMMPWPLTRAEIDQAGGPLRLVEAEQFLDDEDPPKLRWRVEFRRD